MLAKSILVSMVFVSSMAFAKNHEGFKKVCASEVTECKDLKGKAKMKCVHDKAEAGGNTACVEKLNNKVARMHARKGAKSVEKPADAKNTETQNAPTPENK